MPAASAAPAAGDVPVETRAPFADWPGVDRWLAAVLFVSAVVIPVFFLPFTGEIFRLPKLVLFRAEGLILLTVFAIGWLFNSGEIRQWRPRRIDGLLVAAILLWTAVTTLFSTNRPLSAWSVLTVVTGAAVFLAAYRVAPRLSPNVLWILFVPALVNAGVLFLQVAGVPITFSPEVVGLLEEEEQIRLAESALLGNRNDVGTFLQFFATLAWAAAFWKRAPKRGGYLVLALVLTAGVLVSRTVTALAALLAAVVITLAQRSWKRALIAAVVAAVMAGVFVTQYEPLRTRISWLVRSVSAGRFDRALSGRLPAYRAAARMTADHPVTGVGPGRYRGHFFDYVLVGIHTATGPAVNFGETHNDYLQTAAESGLPGLALLVAAIAVFATVPGRRASIVPSEEPEEPRNPRNSPASFARQLLVPFAVSFSVVALAQFPLQLAATMVSIFTIAGLLRGWVADKRGADSLSAGPRVASPRVLGWVGSAVIALLCAWAIWEWCVTPLRIDLAKPGLKAATETVTAARNASGAVPLARENVARIETLLQKDPYDLDLLLLLANNYEVMGRTEEALAVIQRALAIEPRPELHFAASMLYLQTGNINAATEAAVVAVRFEPKLVLELSGALRDDVRRRVGLSRAR